MTKPYGEVLDEMDHQAKYQPATIAHEGAVAELKLFVIHEYDGSVSKNFKLDELLWAVRLAHPHNHPKPLMRPTETAVPVEEIEIDLEELGL